MLRGLLCFLIVLCLPDVARAADALRLIRSVPVQARLVTMDELGNIYVVRHDNLLVRYNEQGDSTGFYRSVLNGDIQGVDATNPLRLLLYYPAFSKVVLLDRMLAVKSEIDLQRRNIFLPTAVATSSDGNLWVYDPFNARLLKLDETGGELRGSNDLRQQLNFVPTPSFMLERDRREYVSDTARGILVFDQFATYINTLPLYGVRQLQAFDQQLIYLQGDTLHSYDMRSFADKTLLLPAADGSRVTGAAIGPHALAVLYPDRLDIFAWPPGK